MIPKEGWKRREWANSACHHYGGLVPKRHVNFPTMVGANKLTALANSGRSMLHKYVHLPPLSLFLKAMAGIVLNNPTRKRITNGGFISQILNVIHVYQTL